MRRKRLCEIAVFLNCNLIALGHHKDDILETFLLNAFFSRQLSTMVPRQQLFRGLSHLVRPLSYIDKRLLIRYTAQLGYEPVARRWLAEIEAEEPLARDNLLRALGNVKPEYLLTRRI